MTKAPTQQELEQAALKIGRILLKFKNPASASAAHILAHYGLIKAAFTDDHMDEAISYVDLYANDLKKWIRDSSQ